MAAPRSMWLWTTVIVGAVLLVVAAWALTLPGNTSDDRADITYSAFRAQVAAGNLPWIMLRGYTITGAFGRPLTAAADGHAGEQVQVFRTSVPAPGDPTLLPLLSAHHVDIAVQPAPPGPQWGPIIAIAILPVLAVAGVLLLGSRRSSGGQDRLFDFARSKPRVYDAAHTQVTFDDVAGVEEAKQELEEVVDFLRDPQKFSRLGGKMPKGILLAGPPGTGKTLLAKAVAGEARTAFFSLAASEFVEMLVGVGASRVRDLFAKAKSAAPAIIFVDELDAVSRQRGAGLGGGQDEREQTLNQLLVEMDGFDPRLAVIVMAATNRPDVLDPALLRPLPLAPDVDLATLARATLGLAGAELANLVNEAAILAARGGAESVHRSHFELATDKVLIGPERTLLHDEQERRLVAYHEGGHALTALLSPKADPVQKVSIVPRGQALGVTLQLPLDDRHNYPEDYLLTRMAVMPGGRVAEQLVFGVATSGAENDLDNVTRLARQMVARWGKSERIGRLAYNVGQQRAFLGRETATERDFSEQTAALIDDEMRALVEAVYQQTRALLVDHRQELDRLAEALLEHESLNQEELATLLEGAAPGAIGLRRQQARRPRRRLRHPRRCLDTRDQRAPKYVGQGVHETLGGEG